MGLLTALLLSAAVIAPAATAAPLAPAGPTFYMSQVRSGDSTSTLRVLTSDRYADSGSGGATVSELGGASAYEYNAVGYRVADGYLYGIVRTGPNSDQLVRVGSGGEVTLLGPVSGLPATRGSDAYLSGAFGEGAYADTLFVKDNTGVGRIYRIDVAGRRVTGSVAPSATVRLFDFTWSDGHLWGGEADGGVRSIVRLDVVTGVVTRLPAGAVFPPGDTGDYGAAWRYGNGNIGLLNNGSGVITQVRIGDPGSATPTITAVSRVQATPGSSNDGASTPAPLPADLVPAVSSPAPVHPASTVDWTVTVGNEGPGPSSGSTFRFPVPAGVTAVQLPVGCALSAGTVTCVVGPLTAHTADDYAFTATATTGEAVSTAATVTVQGNELDPTASTAALVVTPDQELTSEGVGTAGQRVLPGVPAGGAVVLLDGSTPVGALDVDGGRYAVDGDALTFTPAYGWSGTARTARFRVTDGTGATGIGGWAATVHLPPAPLTPLLTSTGAGTSTQQVLLPVPPVGGAVTLLDQDGEPAPAPAVPGRGSWTSEAATGRVTFSPELGFTGTAAVGYRVTDAYGQSAVGSYEATVTVPAGPVTPDVTSVGTGTAPQQVAVPPAPAGGSRTLVDGTGAPASAVTVPGQGGYTLDPATGAVRFAPVLGFAGAGAVRFRLTDAYGSTSEGVYRPQVLLPAPPVAGPLNSSGVGTAVQSVTVPSAPVGGTRTLLDADGVPSQSVDLPGRGVAGLDPVTGVATLVPQPGSAGTVEISYRLTDAYGQATDGLWSATVAAVGPATAPDPTGVPAAPVPPAVPTPPVPPVVPAPPVAPVVPAPPVPPAAPVVPAGGSPTLAWTGADLRVWTGEALASVAAGLALSAAGRTRRPAGGRPAARRGRVTGRRR
ncbi:hypothetical protein KUM42_10985 [Modestobacter sp. L9-4]|uniref:DUF6923 family protein n=1 Tax=Modestobacter sp. L9-4 TaxID=2851567 RepID=UPI001C795724|nr:hypothetical protein [Modestobacter sp. L9-4]QXG74431.1 hypothetical protein KUM42_10985 [Modestobacter sp. L9-4]